MGMLQAMMRRKGVHTSCNILPIIEWGWCPCDCRVSVCVHGVHGVSVNAGLVIDAKEGGAYKLECFTHHLMGMVVSVRVRMVSV